MRQRIEHRQFVVPLGCGMKGNASAVRHCIDRQDDREHWFEVFALANAHVDAQVVAAGSLDFSYLGCIIFGTGTFQHDRRVDLLRRAHSNSHRISERDWSQSKQTLENIQPKSCGYDALSLCAARNEIKLALYQIRTREHTNSKRQCTVIRDRSDVSFDVSRALSLPDARSSGGSADATLSPLTHSSRVQTRARKLAGRARGDIARPALSHIVGGTT